MRVNVQGLLNAETICTSRPDLQSGLIILLCDVYSALAVILHHRHLPGLVQPLSGAYTQSCRYGRVGLAREYAQQSSALCR